MIPLILAGHLPGQPPLAFWHIICIRWVLLTSKYMPTDFYWLDVVEKWVDKAGKADDGAFSLFG